MLKLDQLTTGYGSRVLLRNVNCTLADGELVALLGANGAGKSTLLRIMSGAQQPLSGRVVVNGIDITGVSRQKLARIVSVVNTDKVEAESLKVHEVVAMGRYPYTGFFGRLGRTDLASVEIAMDAVGVLPLRERNVASLSDGERQKVMIARALAQDTPVILLDEPTAFLDVASRVETLSLLSRLAHEKQKTIVMSSHDVSLSLELADKVWLVAGDETLVSATPADLIADGQALNRLFANRGVKFDLQRLDYIPANTIVPHNANRH